MSEEYVRIVGRIILVRPKAVLWRPDGEITSAWIPRSLIHGADETGIDRLEPGTPVELRVFEWFAHKEGLL